MSTWGFQIINYNFILIRILLLQGHANILFNNKQWIILIFPEKNVVIINNTPKLFKIQSYTSVLIHYRSPDTKLQDIFIFISAKSKNKS